MGIDDDVELKIGPKTKANEVMRVYPETTDYFMELGVCSCEFNGEFGKLPMKKTLEEIARDKNVPLEELLEKINKIIGL